MRLDREKGPAMTLGRRVVATAIGTLLLSVVVVVGTAGRMDAP